MESNIHSSAEARLPKPIRVSNALFAGGLYIALGGACISNLRITPSGPQIILKGGGYPFLYEVGVAMVLLATLLMFFQRIPVISKRQKLALIGLALFYTPIFLNYFFSSIDVTQFIGGGQLRLQLEVWLLGTALILYPTKKRTIHRAMIVVVVMALANSLYSISIFQGLVEPMYVRAWRVPWRIRHTGFLEMPGLLGVLSAVAIAWALWLSPKKAVAIAIVCICTAGIIIADSRTGMAAALVIVAARILSRRKLPDTLTISVSLLCLGMATVAVASIPANIWAYTRPTSILAAIQIWLDNPFGVRWGTFDKFNPYYGRAISPHNWPAIALLYGGIFSFIAVVAAHIWLLRYWLINRGVRSDDDRLQASLVLILIAITVSSWLEQMLQTAYSAFIYVVALGALSQKWSNVSERFKEQQQSNIGSPQ